jgi:hypothetical protein
MTLPVGMRPEIRADSERSYLGLGSLCQDVASSIISEHHRNHSLSKIIEHLRSIGEV